MEITKDAQETDIPGMYTTTVRWDHSDAGAVYLAVRNDGQWLFEVKAIDDQRGVLYRTIAGDGFPERGADGWVPGMSMDPDAGELLDIDGWEFRQYSICHYVWQTPIREISDVDAVAAGIAHAAKRDAWNREIAKERDALGNVLAGHVPPLLRHPIESPERRAAVEQALVDIGNGRVKADSVYWRIDRAVRDGR